MKKDSKLKYYTFDFNLSVWVSELNILAGSEEEAREIFNNMNLADIIEEGTTKNFEISDLTVTEEEDDDDEEWSLDWDDEDEELTEDSKMQTTCDSFSKRYKGNK